MCAFLALSTRGSGRVEIATIAVLNPKHQRTSSAGFPLVLIYLGGAPEEGTLDRARHTNTNLSPVIKHKRPNLIDLMTRPCSRFWISLWKVEVGE